MATGRRVKLEVADQNVRWPRSPDETLKLHMKTTLIGCTGFIGQNLARQFHFDAQYHRPNIAEIREREFDLLALSGVSAVKWQANKNPEQDRAQIDSLLSDLSTVTAKEAIVFSTVDVYPVSEDVDESFDCQSRLNHAYGTNRLYFEDSIRSMFPRVTIIRIAGVFGPGLKKNVIYDLIHDNCLEAINPDSVFQYYDVSKLWEDTEEVRKHGIELINFVTQPIRTGDIIDRLFPGKQVGANAMPPARYNIKTKYNTLWGEQSAYMRSAESVLDSLNSFVGLSRGG